MPAASTVIPPEEAGLRRLSGALVLLCLAPAVVLPVAVASDMLAWEGSIAFVAFLMSFLSMAAWSSLQLVL